jgi:hypothetical protein
VNFKSLGTFDIVSPIISSCFNFANYRP